MESVLLITGGSALSSTEIFPSPERACSSPDLPSDRFAHTSFLTSEPRAQIAVCGGYTEQEWTSSCLVLDQINQRWDNTRMGSLTMARGYAAVARLNYVGVFLIGGNNNNNQRTSEFLAAGTLQWREGPTLPEDMTFPCAVTISATTFLVVHGTGINEFDARIAGPTSSLGWRASSWPTLRTSTTHPPGCAKVGQKVIVVGGGEEHSSTQVLDLDSHKVTSAGKTASPRQWFHMATMTDKNNEPRTFALGGAVGGSSFYSAEEWVPGNSSWKAGGRMGEKRRRFGAVLLPKQLLCPL